MKYKKQIRKAVQPQTVKDKHKSKHRKQISQKEEKEVKVDDEQQQGNFIL